MNQIIKITPTQFRGTEIQTVDARELYAFLESKQEFANWIKNRIQEYGFIENHDFLIILSKSTGGRPSKEYHITLDMAKELSMVERNEKGREARQYFIECERRLQGVETGRRPVSTEDRPLLPIVEDAIGIANAFGFTGNQGLLSANRMIRNLHGIDCLELMGQKVLVCEKQELHLTPTEIGKQLGGISVQKINQLLKKAGVIVEYKDTKGQKKWKPTDKGKTYVIMKDTGKKHGDGTPVQQMFFLESVIGLIPARERNSHMPQSLSDEELKLSADETIRLTDAIARAHRQESIRYKLSQK